MVCPRALSWDLFLIHINDLPNVSNKLTFFLFADDTNIHFESDNPNYQFDYLPNDCIFSRSAGIAGSFPRP